MPDFVVDLAELESCRLAIVSLADEFGQLAQQLVVGEVDLSGLGASAARFGQSTVEVVSTARTQLGAAQSSSTASPADSPSPRRICGAPRRSTPNSSRGYRVGLEADIAALPGGQQLAGFVRAVQGGGFVEEAGAGLTSTLSQSEAASSAVGAAVARVEQSFTGEPARPSPT